MLRFTSTRSVRTDVLFAPYFIALALYVPLLALFLATPDSVFRTRYLSSKYSSLEGAIFYALAIALFAGGALVGDLMARRRYDTVESVPQRHARATLVRLCVIGLALAVFGYAVWFGLAVSRAGGVGALVDTYRSDPATVRNYYFASVAGVTTLTQMAIGAVAVAVAYGLFRRRLVAALVGLVIVLSALVAVLASQRLALVELAVPIAYLAVAGRKATLARLTLVTAAVVLVVGSFFISTEIRRTSPYRPLAAGDAVYRFFEYYLGSINNAFALADRYSLATPFYFATQPVWEFPGASHAGLTYEAISGIDAEELYAPTSTAPDNVFVATGTTPRISTFGLAGQAAADFGWAAPLWFLGLGGVVGAVYRAASRRRFYRALYAVWIVGLLDFVRIDYFLATRVVPTYAVLAAIFLLVERRPRPDAMEARARATAVSPSVQE